MCIKFKMLEFIIYILKPGMLKYWYASNLMFDFQGNMTYKLKIVKLVIEVETQKIKSLIGSLSLLMLLV